jgi:vacuolar-type H+-ATPase subunit I/STV1
MNKVEQKKKSSIISWGMWASLIIGVFYFAIGVLMIFDPAEKYRGMEYLRQLYNHPLIPHIWRYMFVIVAFITILWISAADIIIRKKSDEVEGLYKWVKLLGYAAAIISAIQWYKETFQWHFLENFLTQNTVYTSLISAIGTGIDPDYVWMFGALGTWYLVSSILAKRHQIFNKKINVFGILSGVALIITMIFAMTDTIVKFPDGSQMAVMQFTSLIGGVSGGFYHVFAFFCIRKNKQDMLAE